VDEMAVIDIKLSQKVVNQMGGFDQQGSNISTLFGIVVDGNNYITENSNWAYSGSIKGNTLSMNLGGGATLKYTGTMTPDFAGSYYGSAVASSRIVNMPKYFKETVTGNLHYDYFASPNYFEYIPTQTSTINTYKLETYQNNASLGKSSYSLAGAVTINSVNGEIAGSLSNLTVEASKVGKTEIVGNFEVSGDQDDPYSSAVTGLLTQYNVTYIDKSYRKISGNFNIESDSRLDDSIFADQSNFSGDDTISVLLPKIIYSNYRINSGDGNDVITVGGGGGGGRIVINAGGGDDEITINDATPSIDGGDGNDVVKSSHVSIDLRNYTGVENITLLGGKALSGTGNGEANIITGNKANNIIDGQGGGDTLEGGAGNDTYIVYGDGETIIDSSGVDHVRSYASWILVEGLENLTLIGDGAFNATGNSGKNTITGNTLDNVLSGEAGNDVLIGGAGNDTLDGGEGADKMIGGTGDDVYVVDNAKDIVVEKNNEGFDAIETTLNNYSIAKMSAIEKLIYIGINNSTMVGNQGDNIIEGGAGNDTLNGGSGADTLVGGDGNDLYIVDNVNDIIEELNGQGVDLVHTTVTYTLQDHVENLTLIGKKAINGTGNSLDNHIIGNGGSNILNGGGGDDLLDGGSGNDLLIGGDGDDVLIGGLGRDTLTGGDGVDSFRFSTSLGKTNIDTITDFEVGVDRIELDRKIFKKLMGKENLEDHFVIGGTGVKALDVDDHIIFNTETGALFYDSNGSAKSGAIQFATLVGVTDLSASDFWIV
jgi:Ca2+-binding RTX toxin-like protein